MSDAVFRKLALALPETEEKSHFGKPDFRVRNKIFAGFRDNGQAYVKLPPETQAMLVAAESKILAPIPGGWGRQGWTQVDQNAADETLLKSLLTTAYKHVAPKKLVAQV
jgi:hypothetical protein